MTETHDTYTIGEFAAITGLTRRALRLYEDAGLITPQRGPNNYRRYTAQQRADAEVIRDLRASGLSIDAITRLFAIKRADVPPAEKLQAALVMLDRLHDDLTARRRAIDAALARLDDDRRAIRAHLEDDPS